MKKGARWLIPKSKSLRCSLPVVHHGTRSALLLIPVVIGLVMLTRWMRGRRAFTERDWLFLFGHPREKVLLLHLWST
jgi:hypothetical protein